MQRLLFDTESNGFVKNATKVHCIAAVDVDTRETWDFRPHELGAACELLAKADVLIGQNIQRHDLPLMAKLLGFKKAPDVAIKDTMIIARLKHPNIRETDAALVASGKMPRGKDYIGKHSIAAWGYRLGIHKGDYSKLREAEAKAKGIDDPDAIARYVWGEWNEEMHAYMIQDRATNLALWDHLHPDQMPEQAVVLEHDIALFCDEMEQAGVPFDIEAAGKLHTDLLVRKAEVEQKLCSQFGFWYAPAEANVVNQEFTPKVNNKTLGYVKGQPLCKIKKVEFNPGSRAHIAKVLTDRGWRPTKFTEGGKPEIDEAVVESIVAQFPEMDGLGDYLMIDKRLSQLSDGKQAWLKHVGEDGHIHGVCNPMGTVTSRAAHFNPNLGQVPAATAPYGPQCRALFGKRKGWKLVGADASGLELRGLAHYLHPYDGGKFAEATLRGDVHWSNAQVIGLVPDGTERCLDKRDPLYKLHGMMREHGSKRFIYAYIYGCWDEQAGIIILDAVNAIKRENPEWSYVYDRFFSTSSPGVNAIKRVGKAARERFLTRIDGFTGLKEQLTKQVDKFGWVPGLDKRRVPVRSDHSALNFLIQSCGAIICKRWIVEAMDELRSRFKQGWDGDFVPVLWVHDEVQIACREEIAEEVGSILVKHAKAAGAPYGFRVELDSEYKVGRTWLDTH